MHSHSWPCTSLPAEVGQGGSDLDPKFHEHKVIHIPWQAGVDLKTFNNLTRQLCCIFRLLLLWLSLVVAMFCTCHGLCCSRSLYVLNCSYILLLLIYYYSCVVTRFIICYGMLRHVVVVAFAVHFSMLSHAFPFFPLLASI